MTLGHRTSRKNP